MVGATQVGRGRHYHRVLSNSGWSSRPVGVGSLRSLDFSRPQLNLGRWAALWIRAQHKSPAEPHDVADQSSSSFERAFSLGDEWT